MAYFPFYTPRHPRTYKPFLPAEDARIIELRSKGASVAEVANATGRKKTSIQYRLLALRKMAGAKPG